MTQESGFFFGITDSSLTNMGEPTLIHSSQSGPCELYRARKDGSFRVFKALKKEYRGNPLYETMLHKEYLIGYSLEHPSICRTYSFLNIPDIGNCIELEWIDGRTLDKFMEEGHDKKTIKRVLVEVCEALDYIHSKQVIHRDLKPSNILVSFNGDKARVIDFGVSDTDSNYIQKNPAGTFSYASPEILSSGHVDSRTDIWSMGIILSEFKLYPSVIRKCLRRDPRKRFQSFKEVQRSIENDNKITKWIVVSIIAIVAIVCIALICHRSKNLDDKYFESATEAIENANSLNLGL